MTEITRGKTQLPPAVAAQVSASLDASAPRSSEVVYLREFLGFTLADERYAVPLESVREILKPPPITEVPRARQEVLGIITVRGRVTTIVDLRRRLRLEERPPTRLARILLVAVGEEVMGALVDEVHQVYRFLDEQIELASAAGETADYVLGIGRPTAQRQRSVDRRHASDGVASDDIIILLEPRALLSR